MRGQASREGVASDLAQAKERARADVDRARSAAAERTEGDSSGQVGSTSLG